MKWKWQNALRTIAFITFLLTIYSGKILADVPPPPGGSGGSGPGGSDLPVGAPLSSGTQILIFLGVSYLLVRTINRKIIKREKMTS